RFLVVAREIDGVFRPRLMLCRWSDKADRVSCEVPRGFVGGVLSPDGSHLVDSDSDTGVTLVYETGDLKRPPEQHAMKGKRYGVWAYHPSGEILGAVS